MAAAVSNIQKVSSCTLKCHMRLRWQRICLLIPSFVTQIRKQQRDSGCASRHHVRCKRCTHFIQERQDCVLTCIQCSLRSIHPLCYAFKNSSISSLVSAPELSAFSSDSSASPCHATRCLSKRINSTEPIVREFSKVVLSRTFK